jgi:NAD(P)H-hydrate epimerase
MATAGSGDVLSGILTALAGWMEDVRFAAVAAAWINGRAGELAEAETNSVSMVAGDTVRCIPRVISGLLP